MIRIAIACGAVTTLTGVAGLLIREYLVYNGEKQVMLSQSNQNRFDSADHSPIYLYYASPALIVSGVFLLVAAVLKLTLAEPRVIIVQRLTLF